MLQKLLTDVNLMPPQSDTHWCCYALFEPVWHRAPWQSTIFSVPQCVTSARARFYHGKSPRTHWEEKFGAIGDLTVKNLRVHTVYTLGEMTNRCLSAEKKNTRVQPHLPAHAHRFPFVQMRLLMPGVLTILNTITQPSMHVWPCSVCPATWCVKQGGSKSDELLRRQRDVVRQLCNPCGNLLCSRWSLSSAAFFLF